MPSFRRTPPGRSGLALALALLGACGRGEAGQSWWSEDAAMFACGAAGRNRAAPTLLGVPVPAIPTGLYARNLDPMALDGLGFARDWAACAVLETPTEEAIAAAQTSIEALAATITTVNRTAQQVGGVCTCSHAEALGYRELLPACLDRAVRAQCSEARDGEIEAVAAALQPVLDAIESTTLPLVHWRLVGRSDRPGRVADLLAKQLALHPGGSTLFFPRQPVPRRDNHELIRALLEHDGVVLVARQDGGRALLVVRELGSLIVLDHFRHPGVAGAFRSLLGFLDNANLDDYEAALQKPERARRPALDPKEGSLVEVDRPALQRVDDMIGAANPLLGVRPTERPDERLHLVDRVTVQAPFGHEGRVLQLRLAFSEKGRSWAEGLVDELLSPTLEELRAPGAEAFVPQASDAKQETRGAGAVDALLFDALMYLPTWGRALEMQHPGTVGGTQTQWSFELPLLPETLPSAWPEAWKRAWQGLREALAQRPYRMRSKLDESREGMTILFEPRSAK